ncbi:MAG TPA: metallopeptidase TldD-related protein [Micromonosporaceae bacterium]|nr:metallopeptidase TldD-related protein [Micromonosporaceae bacterium]
MTSQQLDLAGRVVELAQKAAQDAEVEATVEHDQRALSRFANSAIHQNVAEATTTVRLTMHIDGRTVAASSTLTDPDALDELVSRTVAAARLAPVDPGWPGVCPPTPLGDVAPDDGSVAAADPDRRASIVKAFVEAAGGLTTAGYCQTWVLTTGFANSAGHAVAGTRGEVTMDGIARTSTSDGLARLSAASMSDIDGAVLGARAATKARAAVDPVELPPGRYEVVLEPTAVADILHAMAMFGFDGKAYNEGRSVMEPGKDQFDPSVTIVDDAVSRGMIGLPFDTDGTPKRRILLVDGGRTVTCVFDRRAALKAGVESTGHALRNTMGGGAYAVNIGIEPSAGGATPTEVEGPAADSTVAALVANVGRGVLVTDHWYTRVLDPKTLVMTGLTRNGVWLIENGEVTRPLRNFRFTQSYPQALGPGGVLGIGTTAFALPHAHVASSGRAPALHLASWNFTGGASG